VYGKRDKRQVKKSNTTEFDVKSKKFLDDTLLKKWRREDDLELVNYLPKTAIKPTEE
jgi:non-ribosomal peptide synthetase component E (peptide arylation enzyme)